MKTLPTRLLVILGVLLALLLAASCDDNGPDGPILNELFGVMSDQTKMDKVEAFRDYKTKKLFLSRTTVLVDMNQFEESLKGLAPYAANRLKYNFVIDTEHRIVVAEWVDDVALDQTWDVKCPGGRNFILYDPQGMINFYPEEAEEKWQWVVEDKVPRSPCWLNERGDRRDGLLDALSKHFLLAQGPEKTIDNFKDDWENTRVRYAGEIIVDLVSCTYSVNNGSGTYGPEGNRLPGELLPTVADIFAKELGVRPAAFDKTSDKEVSTKKPEKISNMPPFC